ncbi:MAG: response regulator [Mucilaginibacter sp.]|nr:response regulator [Mucilaginibacter sp.]
MSARILICDDEQEILDITQMILEDEGYQVTSVSDSRTVEKIVETERPDILLIDLWMPGIPGDQIVRNLRCNNAVKDLPVVVVSASRAGKETAFSAGADDFLAKPYEIEALIDMVSKHLNKGQKLIASAG